MNQSIILHHYQGSPYSEKIRLMFGYTNTVWFSLLSPPQPPRPNLDPLTGGYRRIPVAQVGADIFCDTDLIACELARATQHPELDPTELRGCNATSLEQSEGDAAFAALNSIPPYRLLGSIVMALGPVGAFRLVKDRRTAFSDGNLRRPNPKRAKPMFDAYLDAIEARLQVGKWVNGDKPSLADFASYHPIWCYRFYGGKALKTGPGVSRWLQDMAAFGHGIRRSISRADAFKAARESEPRELPESVADTPLPIGSRVKVAPEDYCVVPVVGKFAALTRDRIVLARETSEFGRLHVHFPRAAYSITAE